VIVDTAPQADRAAAQAAKIADLVVAPLQPSIVDLDAVDATIDVCKLAGVPILFVLNRVPAQGREIDGTENAIKKRGMRVAAVRWGERKAFKYPFMRGLVAQEIEPNSRAAAEVAALFDALDIPSGTHVHAHAGRCADVHAHRSKSVMARKNLFNIDEADTGRTEYQPPAAEGPTLVPTAAAARATDSKRQAYREGKRAVMFFLSEEAFSQMHVILARQRRRKVQSLMEELVDDWFRRQDAPRMNR
jgi:hypothetical protein